MHLLVGVLGPRDFRSDETPARHFGKFGHYKNPRTKLLASPKITLDLLKFGRIPDCARIAAWAGLPGSWIHLDAGWILLQPVMGPEGSDVYSYRLR